MRGEGEGRVEGLERSKGGEQTASLCSGPDLICLDDTNLLEGKRGSRLEGGKCSPLTKEDSIIIGEGNP